MKLYNVTDAYVDYLKQFDLKVPENKAEKRPFVGIVFSINGYNFFAPLSSPKPKYRRMKNMPDFHKINSGLQGVINFNNMIHIPDSELISIDIDNLTDVNYKNLLNAQIQFINGIHVSLEAKARSLYQLVGSDDEILTPNQLKVKQRCCNFGLLQNKSKLYKK